MKSRISICILLCLAILASSIAAAQDDLVVVTDKATYEAAVQAAAQAYCPPYGQAGALASGTFGTKVKAGDEDVGLPLSIFSPLPAITGIPGATPAVTPQATAYISYWDVGATPGSFDNQDAVYLQFGGSTGIGGSSRIIRANNIRMTGWGNYPAGSYVKQGDSDIGQQLLPIPPAPAVFPSAVPNYFAYMEVDGGLGYGLEDPVYIDLDIPGAATGTNDVRLTSFAGFQSGSRVSNADSDAARPLLPFFNPFPILPAGPSPTGPPVINIAQLAFFNKNGNAIGPFSQAIYDEGDVVYFDVNPLGEVSPNDIRLY